MVLSLAGCNTYTSGDETTQEKTTAAAGSASADKESTTEGAQNASGTKELRIGVSTDAISLDTSVINDNNSGEILFHTAEGLLRNLEGEIVPGIAETYDVSEDGLTYTFHLRDAKWEDGEPITCLLYTSRCV